MTTREAPTGDGDGVRLGTPVGRWVLVTTVLGSGIALLDATVVGIALPTLGRSLHTDLGPLQWVVTGYTLTLSALLLLGGSLGDRLGRRRIYVIGVAWFAVASALCGLAPNAPVLIATRVLQGVGAALLTPGSLAILQASFVPDDRSRAIGTWSGFSGIASAAGPLVGGYLLAVASWRWIFFINLPLAVVTVVIALRFVPETRDPTTAGHVDYLGAALAFVALAGVTFGLIQGPTDGWGSPVVLVMLGVGVLAGAAFVLAELRESHPMLPLGVFRSRQFSAANAVTFVVYAALGGSLFLLPTTLQVCAGYTPLESGVAILPIPAIMLVLSGRSGRLSGVIGPRLQMSVGPVGVALGLALLTRASGGSGYLVDVFPGVVVIALGLATTVAPLTATAMSSAPTEHAGSASAVNNDVARIGGLLAVAVLPALSGITGMSYLHADQLSSGFATAMWICAGLSLVGAALSVVGIRNPGRAAGPPDHRHRVTAVHPIPVQCGLDAPTLRR
jgi:EmrB/QacA subfamily drug resistance transporter